MSRSDEAGRVLVVDDEPRLLGALRRTHGHELELATAEGAAEALELLAERSFAVLVSDLRMPGMDGLALLRRVREVAPDTVRILMTGSSDLEIAVKAVNEAGIFRFLTKPCDHEEFRYAVRDALAQRRLLIAERVLLEETLRGAVQVLSDILCVANPAAFGRSHRALHLLRQVAAGVPGVEPWVLETATMLSQIGCVTVPADILERAAAGAPLTEDEHGMLDAHPAFGRDVLAAIPRLEPVAEVVAHQQRRFDGAGDPPGPIGRQIPVGARLLKIALDLDALESRGTRLGPALGEMRRREGAYDPELLELFRDVEEVPYDDVVRAVSLDELNVHMMLDEDVRDLAGRTLLQRGQRVTPGQLQRLRNYAARRDVREPIRVRIPRSPAEV